MSDNGDGTRTCDFSDGTRCHCGASAPCLAQREIARLKEQLVRQYVAYSPFSDEVDIADSVQMPLAEVVAICSRLRAAGEIEPAGQEGE